MKNPLCLSEYNIKHNSNIHLVLKCSERGPRESFAFNGINELVTLQLSRWVPKWISLNQGISWVSNCENPNCEAFMKEVIWNKGFGVFDVLLERKNAVCPICKKTFQTVQNCGFFKTKWKYFGKDAEGVERRNQGVASGENYTVFLEGGNENWEFLRVEVKPLRFQIYV